MTSKNYLFAEETILANDYREFLRKGLAILRKKQRGFSLAKFSRTAEFGSRGFILDVVRGDRRLTTRSLPKAVKGLGLKGKLKKYFIALVYMSEADINPDSKTPDQIANVVGRLRIELLDELRQNSSPRKIDASDFFCSLNTLVTYSALGSYESGASIAQICSRTNLTEQKIVAILEEMCQQNIVTESQGTFRAINSHLFFKEIGNNDAFQKTFFETLRRVREQAQKMDNGDRLFFNSTLPLDRKKIPILKQQLRSTLTEFIHENQNDDGDHVAIVQLAFF